MKRQGIRTAGLRNLCTALVLTATAMPMLLPIDAAEAVTVTTLGNRRLDDSFGQYAPGGDCTRQPRIAIDATGFTFTAGGQTIHPARFEWAVSYGGPDYQGISNWFFPFIRTDDDLGPLLLTLNADDKRGRLTIENNDSKPLTGAYGALVQGSPYARCGKTAAPIAAKPAPVASARPPIAGASTPLEWSNLAQVSASGAANLFGRGAIPIAIGALIGPKVAVLENNLSVSTPLTRAGNLYHVSGNADHRGGYDMAYIVIDPAQRAIEIGLWERGKLTIYRTAGKRVALPAEIAKFRSEQPPEDAEAAPGPPWELRPVAGQSPLAFGQPAASPHISTISLYCDKGQPFLAMVLHRGANANALKIGFAFNGGLVDVQMGPMNAPRTAWFGGIGRSSLARMLVTQKDRAYLRIDNMSDGEVNLAGAAKAVRTALSGCLKM